MPYGTLKVDNITYTSGGSDASTSVSGIVALQAGNFNNITATGTISGATIVGPTHTGSVANFVSGVFTTQVSGATVAGPTHTGNIANFASGIFTSRISGATITGDVLNITSGNAGTLNVTTLITPSGTDLSVAGNIVVGGSGFFGSGLSVTGTISGITVTGTNARFTNITGVTVTGATANFSSGNFTGTVSGNTVRDVGGNVRDIPQVVQTTSYTLVATDAGDHIFTSANVTVPSGVFSVGNAVTIYNNSASNITISGAAGVTLRQAGSANTGARTLAQRGLATILCVSGTVDFVINGGGLS